MAAHQARPHWRETPEPDQRKQKEGVSAMASIRKFMISCGVQASVGAVCVSATYCYTCAHLRRPDLHVGRILAAARDAAATILLPGRVDQDDVELGAERRQVEGLQVHALGR